MATNKHLVVAAVLVHALAAMAAVAGPGGESPQAPSRPGLLVEAYPTTPAKPAALPSDAVLKREMERVERQRKEVFAPANPVTANPGNNFPQIPAPTPSAVDIQALARRYEQRAQARKTDDLMIFVSFSMPAASLKRIVAQGRQVGASVVLNGFKNNSMKETTQAIQNLGEGRGHVVVNPNAFAKYRIRSVPAVVLTKPNASDHLDAEGCALPDTYASVVGDVSLDYSLDTIARRDARFTEVATRFANQVRGDR